MVAASLASSWLQSAAVGSCGPRSRARCGGESRGVSEGAPSARAPRVEQGASSVFEPQLGHCGAKLSDLSASRAFYEELMNPCGPRYLTFQWKEGQTAKDAVEAGGP